MKRILTLVLTFILIGSMALAEVYVLATADPTYVRSAPEIAENIKGQLEANYLYEWGGHVSVDTRGVEWYDVYYSSGEYGWISGLHGNLYDNETGETFVDHSVTLGKGTSIQADADVNVRSGPGTEYSIIGSLLKGETMDYTGTSQKSSTGKLWYQINYNNQIGWVSSGYTHIM